jgi:hypothetical protein
MKRTRMKIFLRLGLGLCLMVSGVAFGDVKLGTLKEKGKDKETRKEDEKRMGQLDALSPEVKPAQVSFVAGRSVDVELDAAAAVVTGLKFLIREAPKFGTLSEVRPHPTERHKAVVTYTHTGGEANLADSFAYACRLNEGPFSAPARVTLNGRRAEAKLMVLNQAQFGRVLPGTEVMAKVVIANRGIGPFESDLTWPAPWKGPPRVKLGIGETAEMAVFVTPERPGVITDELTLQEGNPTSRVRLWLQCEQPFIVTPGRAQMSYDPQRGLRWVKARLANATAETMTLKLTLPERLKGPSEVEVRAGQLQEIELTLAANDVKAFNGEVTVTEGMLSERLILGASPEPAQVAIVAPSSGKIQFGSHNQGVVGKATLVLANSGGEAAVMAVQAPPPFRVAQDEQSFSVAPGETQKLVMEVDSGKAGLYQGKVVLSGGGSRLELDAEVTFVDPNVIQMKAGKGESGKSEAGEPAGKVARPKAAEVPTVAELAAKSGEMPEETKPKAPVGPTPVESQNAVTAMGRVNSRAAAALSYLSVFGMPTLEKDLSKKYGKLERIELAGVGTDFLELAWEKPNADSPPQSYRVEAGQQVYEPTTKMFFRQWTPFSDVKPLVVGGGKEGVRLAGLRPAAQYELRVLAVDEQGKVSPPSDIYLMTTLAPWKMPTWWWYAGVAVLLGVMLLQARKLYLKRMGLSLA